MGDKNRPGGHGDHGLRPSGGGSSHPRAGARGCPPPAPYGFPPPRGRETGGTADASLATGAAGPLPRAFRSVLGVIFGRVAPDRPGRAGREGHGAAAAGLVASCRGIAFRSVPAVL